MFPRRFFGGVYFAPRYWPESQGQAAAATRYWKLPGATIDFQPGETVVIDFDPEM